MTTVRNEVATPRRLQWLSQAVTEQKAVRAHSYGLTALHVALGIVYIWFGALKVAGTTPVADLVTSTTPWPDPSWFVPVLGLFEVALGVWLVVGRYLLFALPLLVGHLVGTAASLVFLPDIMFQNGNPLLLTTEGEFVVKNIVLLAAGVVASTRARR